ncbi:MAG TPA: flagellar assembly peptidoglycan hydrolase FlgJ [Nevskiaceae bacterium]
MIAAPLAADPRGLAQLKAQAAKDPHSATTQREVARQFETVFAQMMIKSMRDAHVGDDGLGHAGQLYTSMFDQQIAQAMAQGRGIGLANMLMRQFQGPSAKAGLPAAVVAAANAAKATVRPLNAADRIVTPVRTAAASAPSEKTHAAASEVRASGGKTGTEPAAPADVPARIMAFVERLLPQAQMIAKRLGVSARVVIAQAALETGWGKSAIGDHNLFGIKATGNAPAITTTTTEYIDGRPQRVQDRFTRYASDRDAADGYARLVGANPRYRAVLGSGDDARRFATALQKAGYATDPHYAKKLVAVADSSHLNAALDAAMRA